MRSSIAYWLLVGLLLAVDPLNGQAPTMKPDVTEEAPRPKAIVSERWPATILQPGEYPIDLGTALRLAGAVNPELLLARQRVSEAIALRQLAVAQLLPHLNLGTNFDLHRGPLQQSNGNILDVNRDALYVGLGANAIGGGTVNIPGLFYNMNVGEAWYSCLVARQGVITRNNDSAAVRNDVLLRVSLAYTDLTRAEGRLSIAKKNREQAAEVAELTVHFAQTGQGRKADADRALVDLRRRDAELAQAEADILVWSARLAQLINLDTTLRLKPIDGWIVPAPLVPEAIPLGELVAIALLQRPELASRRSQIQSALYELSLARVLPFAPNVLLGFSAGGFGGGSNLIASPVGFITSDGTRVTASRFSNLEGRTDFDVAVFSTFRNLGVGNVALARAAASRAQQSRLRELDTLNLVRCQVAEAYAWAASRRLQIEATEKAVRASQEAFAQDFVRVRGGQGLPLELVDSLRLLSRARNEYLDAVIDYNRAEFQLWVALGQPPADFLARPVPVQGQGEGDPPPPRPLPVQMGK